MNAYDDSCQRFLFDEADARGLERAQEDVGDEFGARGRTEVDHRLVLPRLLVTHRLSGVDLEELDTPELEPTWSWTKSYVR